MRPSYPYAHAPRLVAQGPIPSNTLTEQQSGELEIEIGPGRGMFLLERTAERPDSRLVGLEIRWKWATLLDERLAKQGFGKRARVYAEDARFVLPRIEPQACVDRFFIHFPDPWWKKRQQKRLVIGTPLVDQIARLLKPRGTLFIQTDVPERAQAYDTLLSAHPAFCLDGDSQTSAARADVPWQARGNREKRAIADGIPVFRLMFRRRDT